MTQQELESAVRLLAKAVVTLSERAAHTWDYDGEEQIANGIILNDLDLIQRIAASANSAP